jgi:gluconolactonase
MTSMITTTSASLAVLLSLAQAVPATPPAADSAPKPQAPAAPAAPRSVPLPASASPVADAAGKAGIDGLVAADARPDLIIKGLEFAEGPTADAFGETYFCDLSGAAVYRVVRSATGYRADRIVTASNGVAGLAFSRAGRLYGTQMFSGAIVEVELFTDGTARLRNVIERIGGEARPGCNDLVTTSDGGIWWTNMGDRRKPNRRGIYYSTEAGGEPVQVASPLTQPNGIRLSPDGTSLYAVDYGAPVVWKFPVLGPGKLGDGVPLASLAIVGDPAKVRGGDGMTVDSKGNLWVAVPLASAVVVFDPAGKPLGRVIVPEYPSNCAFGGADGKTLFITARTGVYVLPTLVDGFWTARGGQPAVQQPPAAEPPASIAAPAAPPASPAAPPTSK